MFAEQRVCYANIDEPDRKAWKVPEKSNVQVFYRNIAANFLMYGGCGLVYEFFFVAIDIIRQPHKCHQKKDHCSDHKNKQPFNPFFQAESLIEYTKPRENINDPCTQVIFVHHLGLRR